MTEHTDTRGLTAEEREALAELALVYGTFLMGRWAEVMSVDQEPADDWQEQAALQAVDLFAPGARTVLDAVEQRGAERVAAAVTAQLAEPWDRLQVEETDGSLREVDVVLVASIGAALSRALTEAAATTEAAS